MARPHRLREPDAIYHVTARGNDRQAIFNFNKDKLDYLERMVAVFPLHRIRLLAFALMSNHLHLLVQDTICELSIAMQRLHSGFAKSWNARRQRTGHVFGDRFHSVIIQNDEHLLNASLYIHANPLKGGSLKPKDARWTSVGAYLGSGCDLMSIHCDPILRIADSRAAYSDAFNSYLEQFKTDADRESQLQEFVIRGVGVSGDKPFVASIAEKVERRAERRKRQSRPTNISLESIVMSVCLDAGLSLAELKSTTRRRQVSRARAEISDQAIRAGIAISEIAASIHRSRSAVIQLAKSVQRH